MNTYQFDENSTNLSQVATDDFLQKDIIVEDGLVQKGPNKIPIEDLAEKLIHLGQDLRKEHQKMWFTSMEPEVIHACKTTRMCISCNSKFASWRCIHLQYTGDEYTCGGCAKAIIIGYNKD